MLRRRARGRAIRGFSLIELAIGLTVVAILLVALLVPLAKQLEQRRTSDTARQLVEAREALLAFAMANGRLPCPASDTSNGVEAFDAGGTPTNGQCRVAPPGSAAAVGFLPGVTLGLSPLDARGYVPDAWGDLAATVATDPNAFNRIRYAVPNPAAAINGVAAPITRANGIRDATMAQVAAANTLLSVCGAGVTASPPACGTAVPLANGSAVAVVWSLGANGIRGNTLGEPDSPSLDELQNLDGDDRFVSRGFSDAAGTRFDDQVVWIAPPLLFSRMVTAGRLP